MNANIRCDWFDCKKPIVRKPVRVTRRNFCCRECAKAWEDFQTRTFDHLRLYPTVPHPADDI